MNKLQLSTKNICLPLIIFLPIMLNRSSNLTFNIAISDIFLPFAMVLLIIHMFYISTNSNIRFSTYMDMDILYTLIICIVLSLNLLKVAFLYDVNSVFSSITNIIKIIINIIYFSVFVYCFKIGKKDFEMIFLKAWSLVSIIVSIIGILGVILFLLGIKNSYSYAFRAMSTFNDPNLFATYLFISISFCCIYNYKNKKNIKGWNLYINLIALMLTYSRGAIIGLVLSMIFIFIILLLNKESNKVIKLAKNIVIGIVFLLILAYALNKIYKINIMEDGLNRILDMKKSIKGDSRVDQWICALKIWQINPLWGAGIGKFMDVGISNGFTTHKLLAHNTYLTFLSEQGIIGLLAYIWFPIMLLLKLIKNSMNNMEHQVLIFSIVAICISCASLNLENFRCIWVFWAYCFYSINSSKEDFLPSTAN